MKIISGKYKGRKLEGYDISGTRPTMDRVKESLFGMIQNDIQDGIILDLFSGSGNLGIEALSEGSSYAYLVDYNKKAIETIKKNIQNIGIDNIEVLFLDYKKALQSFIDNHISFDVIFLDPPYKTYYIEESINIISEGNLLNKNGLIVCESDSLDKIIFPKQFNVKKSRKYGDKFIVLLEKV